MDVKDINTIKKQYLNPKIRGSYSGASAFFKSKKPKYKYEDVKYALEHVPVYVQNRPLVKKFKRRRVVVHGIDEHWGIDLIEIGKYSRVNNNYKYLLSIIDVFSKYAWISALKDKNSTTAWKAFLQVLKKSGRKPKKVQADAGLEFKGTFKKEAKKLDIEIFHVYSELKCCVIERFNRTIMEKVSRYIQHKNSNKFIHVLPEILRNYNNNVHRSIRMKPVDVSKENEMDVWMTLYGGEKLKSTSRPKFQEG